MFSRTWVCRAARKKAEVTGKRVKAQVSLQKEDKLPPRMEGTVLRSAVMSKMRGEMDDFNTVDEDIEPWLRLTIPDHICDVARKQIGPNTAEGCYLIRTDTVSTFRYEDLDKEQKDPFILQAYLNTVGFSDWEVAKKRQIYRSSMRVPKIARIPGYGYAPTEVDLSVSSSWFAPKVPSEIAETEPSQYSLLMQCNHNNN